MLHGCEIMNYSLSLLYFCCCDIHPLWFWDCAPLFVPPCQYILLSHPIRLSPALLILSVWCIRMGFTVLQTCM